MSFNGYSMRKIALLILLLSINVTATITPLRDARGRIRRSPAVRREFMREHPCPSTGKRYGACPGYLVDHVKALECGGSDSPSNMQWQTVAAGKAKDKLERLCRLK